MTPHIACEKGAFAPVVLMPGDPKRSAFIAKNYLDGAVLVNDVRGVQGYTGTYRGKPVSVMASGMGQPSIGIYSYELFSFFDVDAIVRVGSCGGLDERLRLNDVVLAMGACGGGNFAAQYRLPGTFCPVADYGLLKTAEEACKRTNAKYFVGNVLSSDVFYDDAQSALEWKKMGVLAVEMECAALYCTAARLGKKALCMCAVSDSFAYGEELSPKERETGLDVLIRSALETAYDA